MRRIVERLSRPVELELTNWLDELVPYATVHHYSPGREDVNTGSIGKGNDKGEREVGA